MERIPTAVASQKAPVILTKVVVGAIVVGFLYVGKPVLLPLGLALFLTLLLTPLITALQRRRVPKTLSVVLVVFLVAIVLSGVITLVSFQLVALIDELPTHTENIKGKVRSVRGLGDGALIERLERMWTEVSAEWTDDSESSRARTSTSPEPVNEDDPSEAAPVVVEQSGPSWTARLPDLLGPVISAVGALGLALVLGFLILLQREALRNRVIRLVGGSLIVTTKAVDEAGERISRYLRMQLIVNSTYGTVWGLGLFFIGLDYAMLWGFMAALLRFVPYVGPWIAALSPLALALAQFSGWQELLTILGLLLALELLSNNVMEPLLYGRSTGVSGVAMFFSAIFWTFVWGPVGLVLSGPITVCLAVIGKYVPQVRFFNLLLGDEPALEPHESYYQRLVARDQDEAAQLVLKQAKTRPLDQIFDETLIPTLNLIKRDRARTDVTEADEQYVVETTRKILMDLVAAELPAPAKPDSRDADAAVSHPVSAAPITRVRMMGIPARDAEDELALQMLRAVLSDREWDFDIASANALKSEWVESVAEHDPAIVCISSLPPGGLEHTRHICKLLRSRFPDLRITVGRWGLRDEVETNQEYLEAVGVDQMATTLRETRDQLNGWLPVFADQMSRESANGSIPDRIASY